MKWYDTFKWKRGTVNKLGIHLNWFTESIITCIVLFIPEASSQDPFHLQWGTYHPSSVQTEHHQVEKVAKYSIKTLGAQKSTRPLSHQGGVQACIASIFLKRTNAKISQQRWRFPKVSLHIQCPCSSLRTSGSSDSHKACKHKPFHHRCSVCSVRKPPVMMQIENIDPPTE